MRTWLRNAAIVGVSLGVGIQLVPYGRDHGAPPGGTEARWPDSRSRELAVAACYDCHSNQTEWPWYSNVAPMSWLVQRDVDRGRDELDFTSWDGDADDPHDAVEDGSMPPMQYTWLHPGARLSAHEKRVLIAALEALDDGGDNSGRGGGDDDDN
jgi:hypothetical protein